MKTYLLKITKEDKDTIEWALAEWVELTKEAIKDNTADEDEEAVKELKGELKKIREVLQKVKRVKN